MGKITEIKKLKKLYRIDLENCTEDKIYVCDDTIVHFILTTGKIITDEELISIINFDQFARGKSLALYYISFRPRTCTEVRKYLYEHEILDEQISEILSVLTENKIIDDKNYAENFIQGKISMSTAGPYQIKQKLYLKGIDKFIIEQALQELYTEEKQIDVAYKLAEKQVRSNAHKLPLKQLKQKIIQNLTTKGFSYSVSSIALDSLDLESDEDNEMTLLMGELSKANHRYSRNYDGYEREQRIIQQLLRKGFSYAMIRSALQDYPLN